MKKILFLGIFFMLAELVTLVAQDRSLYDVNFDKPQNIVYYNEAQETFQRIFLQYEAAIVTAGEIIRQEEKERYFKEIENIKEAEKIRAENTIERVTQERYKNEIEAVRTQELARLTAELTEKINQELNAKLSAEYEEKKNVEITQLYDKQTIVHKQEIERLTAELTEKINQELNTKLSAEYEEKKNSEIMQLYDSLKEEAYKKTEAKTKIIKYIVSAIALVLIIWGLVLSMYLIIGFIRKKNRKNNTFKSLVKEYSFRLRSYNGNPAPIVTEINELYGQKEKEIRLDALDEARNNYPGDIREIQEFKDEFITYKSTLSAYLKAWKDDNTQQIFVYLKDAYAKYKKCGIELYHTINYRPNAEKKQACDLLKEVASELQDISKEIERARTEKQFSKEKKYIAKDFKDLAKSFKKRKFK